MTTNEGETYDTVIQGPALTNLHVSSSTAIEPLKPHLSLQNKAVRNAQGEDL